MRRKDSFLNLCVHMQVQKMKLKGTFLEDITMWFALENKGCVLSVCSI